MEYRIKIEYRTGNSFGSSDESDYIELSWKDLDIAKENLQRINDHYKQYQELNSYSARKNRTTREIVLSNMDKDWFVYKPILVSKINGYAIDEKDKIRIGEENCEYIPDSNFSENCLKLKTDGDIEMKISAFWCGYFEQLYSAEIEIDNNDLKISF